jgi:hypothetical protein
MHWFGFLLIKATLQGLLSIFDVPRCCDVWSDLISDWHRQRVGECSNRINMLFATSNQNKKRKLTCNSSKNEMNWMKSSSSPS